MDSLSLTQLLTLPLVNSEHVARRVAGVHSIQREGSLSTPPEAQSTIPYQARRSLARPGQIPDRGRIDRGLERWFLPQNVRQLRLAVRDQRVRPLRQPDNPSWYTLLYRVYGNVCCISGPIGPWFAVIFPFMATKRFVILWVHNLYCYNSLCVLLMKCSMLLRISNCFISIIVYSLVDDYQKAS